MGRSRLWGFILVLAAALALTGPISGQSLQDKLMKALPEKAPAQPKRPRALLIFSRTKGYRHGSIEFGGKAIIEMGKKTGAYTAIQTEDPSYFTPAKLSEFDAVLILHASGNFLSGPNEELYKKSLVDFVAGGKGLIGIHAAADAYHNHSWNEYQKMMGGMFVSHPWGKVTVKNLEPKNPVNAAFDGKDFEFKDEIYTFANDTCLQTERRILLCVLKEKLSPPDLAQGPKRDDNTYALSWIANYGKGRNFYCAFGHGNEIFVNPMILRHYLAGIQFALGDLQADATPSKRESK